MQSSSSSNIPYSNYQGYKFQNQQNLHQNKESPSYKKHSGLKIHSVQIEQNKSNITNTSNVRTQKSIQQRSGSMSRGIRVLSRNSSFQKKSNNSIQKKSNSNQGQSNFLNCYNNQTVQIHEFKSMQTLKSQIHTYNQMLSDRQKIQKQQFQPKNKGNTKSKFQDNLSYLRKDMQNQVLNIRNIFQNKYKNALDQINAFYSIQIDKITYINRQNQQKIKNQQNLIERLQTKILKEEKKQKKYEERFQSLFSYVQQANFYTVQRINQMDTKLNMIVNQFDTLQNEKFMVQNKIQYLFQIFSETIKKLVLKGKDIENKLKKQVKGLIEKYQYFQQKIYQMDLSKNIGKQNQIQNIRINQKITQLKELLYLTEKRNNLALSKNVMIKGQLPILSQIKNQKQGEEIFKQYLQNITIKVKELQQKKAQIQKNSIKKEQRFKIQLNDLQNKLLIQKEQVRISSQEGEKKQALIKEYKRINQVLSQKSNQYVKYINQLQDKLIQTRTTLQQTENNLFLKTSQKLIREETKLIEKQIQTQHFQQFKKEQIKHCQKEEYQQIYKNFKIQQQELKRVNQQYQQTILQNQQLQKALQYSQQMFDTQIAKFKQHIQDLMIQNQKLKNQSKILQESKSSQNNRFAQTVKMCKSPKKQNSNFKNINWKDAILSNNISKQKNQKVQYTQFQYKKNIKQVLLQSPSSLSSQKGNQIDEQLYSFSKIAKTQSAQSYYNKQQQFISSQRGYNESETSIMKSNENILKYNQEKPHSLSECGQKSKKHTKKSLKIQNLKKFLQFYSNRLPIHCEIDFTGYLKYYDTGKYVMDENQQLFQLNQEEIRQAIQLKLILL